MTATADVLERYLTGEIRPRNPRCKACNLPDDLPSVGQWRREIARMYMEGWAIDRMWREVVPLMREWPAGREGWRISRSGLHRHMPHLEATCQAMRKAVEEQAALDGIDLDVFGGRYLSARAAVKQVLEVGVQDLVAGRIRVSAQDILRIAAMEQGEEHELRILRENQKLSSSLSLMVSLIMELAPPELQVKLLARYRSLQQAPIAQEISSTEIVMVDEPGSENGSKNGEV